MTNEPFVRTAYAPFSLGRVWAIARTTLVQLIRMRAFYFLLIFSFLILLTAVFIDNFNSDQSRELKIVKDMAFFSMSIFCTIFAITATANLLPKDMEDRTLYTILAKPVPRVEYLLGKYVGSMLVIGLSLVVMTALLFAVLAYRQHHLTNGIDLLAQAGRISADEHQLEVGAITGQGVSWKLFGGTAAIGLQALVLGMMTLFVSTFATSGLFTIIVTFILFFIGFIQPIVIDYWRTIGEIGRVSGSLIYLFELVMPNFQSYNVVDGIVAGEVLPWSVFGKLIITTFIYVIGYLFLAQSIFSKKEL